MYARLNKGHAEAKRCPVCRVPLSPDRLAAGVCLDLDCQSVEGRRRGAELAEQRAQQFAEQTRLGTLLRGELAGAAEIADPEQYFVTVVPQFSSALVPLTIERRQAFRSNIESLVNELVSRLDGSEGPTGEPPASPGTTAQTAAPAKRDRLTAAVCAECRGFCCGGGNTRAYLRVDTLRKLIERRPDLHLEQLPEVYTECLPERSYSGSCVFHSERGCALPREMRSDTCNDYFCKGQKDLRAAMENGAPARAFVAISDSTQIVAGRFVNAEVEAALAGGGKVS